MRKLFLALFLLSIFTNCEKRTTQSTTITGSRVEIAYAEKKGNLKKILNQHGIAFENLNLFIRGFKKERLLEIWAKNKGEQQFKKIITYDFCRLSGSLGPKRKEGDLQVPEGVYKIDRLNPKSQFYLSLGLNYPNASDKIRGDQKRPGSDIFIHGACVTVGCIPITDDKIKELYVLVDQAKKNKQEEIKVHIFPTEMTPKNLEEIAKGNATLLPFWKELQLIYQAFEQHKVIPDVSINDSGVYQLQI